MKYTTMALLVCLGLSGCGPSKVSEETAAFTPPSNVAVEPDNHQLTVSWDSYRRGTIAGYNIYITEFPLVESYRGINLPDSIEPYNDVPFPGDTEPEDERENFVADGLENGVKYFVSVRVVYPNGGLSRPSEERMAVCGPRGVIELGQRFRSEHDGYSFEKLEYVAADDGDNDIYFFSKDGVDYLCSPTRLDAFLRGTNLAILPYKGSFDQVRTEVEMPEWKLFGDRVRVSENDWVLMRTPDDAYALIKVLHLTGAEKNRRVELFYFFVPSKTGELLL
jgi:hypothetical protein